jgi:TPR repeat protein
MRRFRGTTRRLWFALAVSSGLSLSLCNLAGADQVAAKKAWTAKDYQTAFQEYSSLAEAGDALAQFFLGTMYSAGQHVPQNPAAAFRWWREAADQGYGPAQVRVAVAYFRGTGVAVDVGEAFHWA